MAAGKGSTGLLVTLGDSWGFLDGPEDSWGILAIPLDPCVTLRVSKGLLRTPGDFLGLLGLLGNSGDSWRLLKTSSVLLGTP